LNHKDLPPKGDVKGGGGICNDNSSPRRHWNNQIKMPSFGDVLRILQIIVIAAIAIGWWSKRESTSSVTDTTQSLIIEEHGHRLDAIGDRLTKMQDSQNKNTDDLHELMTKFRIMVELVDGNRSKPELHK